jgi:glycine oxidase
MAAPDVLIVGGGVIGLTTAYELAKANVRVRVVDRGPLGREASWAGAGIVPPRAAGVMGSPLERLRQRSIELLPRLSDELQERTGIDNEFHACGAVEYGITPAQLAHWRQAGVPFEPIDESTARLPYSQLRNPRHLAALIAACASVRVELRPDSPVDPDRLPAAGQVLIAAGAWSQAFLPPACRVHVRPVRGQIVLFRPSRPALPHIILDGHRYLVPRLDGRVLAGSTEEPEAGFDKVTTPAAIDELIRFAVGHVPALADATIEHAWAGLRPGSGDGWPLLGRIPGTANRYVAAGHFRAGLQLSAATGEAMAGMLRGVPTNLDAFRPDRPAIRLPEPLFRS